MKRMYVFDVTTSTGHAARVPRILAGSVSFICTVITGRFHDYAPTPEGY